MTVVVRRRLFALLFCTYAGNTRTGLHEHLTKPTGFEFSAANKQPGKPAQLPAVNLYPVKLWTLDQLRQLGMSSGQAQDCQVMLSERKSGTR